MHDGDHISFTYEGKHLEGIIVQQKNDHVTVKLSTGYNIIVPAKDLHGALARPASVQEQHKPQIQQNPNLPKISILHTGGTIASKVDYRTGATVAQFDPKELASMFPELLHIAHIESRLLRNMQSDDMRFAHYNLMAREVLEEMRKDVKGIIITHGTDTLHYTSAALSFALEGLNIPVVLVGSQRSSDRGSSDSGANLIGAAKFILEKHVPGVFIAMHETSDDDSIAIIDGLHARKNHTSRRDAFVSVNAPLFARVARSVEVLDLTREAQLRAQAKPRTQVMPFREDLRVGWWRVHTQSFADELAVYDHYDGLLIEGTGLGHAPISEIDEHTAEHTNIREQIGLLAKRIPVAIASQTIYGRVNLNVYSPQRVLQELGVFGSDCDMHPETAFIKLAWLLSNHSADVKKLYVQNLRGEISSRSPLEDSHSTF
jgi:glutamyl-tRNA(Gln) amidotransferase subunit D